MGDFSNNVLFLAVVVFRSALQNELNSDFGGWGWP